MDEVAAPVDDTKPQEVDFSTSAVTALESRSKATKQSAHSKSAIPAECQTNNLDVQEEQMGSSTGPDKDALLRQLLDYGRLADENVATRKIWIGVDSDYLQLLAEQDSSLTFVRLIGDNYYRMSLKMEVLREDHVSFIVEDPQDPLIGSPVHTAFDSH
jgi:hypothetical protein